MSDLSTRLATVTAERDRLDWMLDTFMHEYRYRMNHRAGYAEIFALVKQDLRDDYKFRNCGDCDYCHDPDDLIPGCDNPLIAQEEPRP